MIPEHRNNKTFCLEKKKISSFTEHLELLVHGKL